MPGARFWRREWIPEPALPALLVLLVCLADKLTSARGKLPFAYLQGAETPQIKLSGGWGRKKTLGLGSAPGQTCGKADS